MLPTASQPRTRWPVLLAPIVLIGCSFIGGVKVEDTGYTYEWEIDPEAEVPFGMWGLNGFHYPAGLEAVRDQFGLSLFHTSTYSPSFAVYTLLPMVRDAGMSVNLRMAGDHHWYTNGDGDFEIEEWKAMLEPWEGSGVQEYIDDGTISYHMLLDDIANFEGRSPDGDELEEMARYSKQILPGLPTVVREEAGRVPAPTGGSFSELDAAINQYTTLLGDVEDYALINESASHDLNLDIIMGLNIADGGDGRSGQPGWGENHWAMNADEIVEYGYVLSAVPDIVMFMAWEYDAEELWSDGTIGADYFDRPDNTEALLWLSQRLAGEDVERP